MKKNKTYLVIILIAIFAAIYYFSSGKDVVYTDLAWNVRDGIYTVSFNATNKTKNYVQCKASIRAWRVVNQGYENETKSICGEKIIKIKLRPEESMMLNEAIDVIYRPKMFNVNIFDIKTD